MNKIDIDQIVASHKKMFQFLDISKMLNKLEVLKVAVTTECGSYIQELVDDLEQAIALYIRSCDLDLQMNARQADMYYKDREHLLEQRDAWYIQRNQLKKEIEGICRTSIPKPLSNGWNVCSVCNGDVYETDFYCSTCGAKLDWDAAKAPKFSDETIPY